MTTPQASDTPFETSGLHVVIPFIDGGKQSGPINILFTNPEIGLIDLRIKADRDKVVMLFLEQLRYSENVPMMPQETVAFLGSAKGVAPENLRSVQNVLSQIFCLEFMRRKEYLIATIHSMRSRRAHFGQVDFMKCIRNSGLVMRHLFGSHDPVDVELSESIMLVLLDMAARTMHDLESLSVSESSKVHDLECGYTGYTGMTIPSSICIVSSMRYWRRAHFRIAADNGYSEIIGALFQQAMGTKRSMAKLFAFLSAYSQYFIWAKKRDPHGKYGLVRYMAHSLSRYGNVESMQSLLDMSEKNPSGPTILRQANRVDDQCGWPPCGRMKKKDSFALRSVCAGCRCIRYCCRNHQKRHWSYMHREQCRFTVDSS